MEYQKWNIKKNAISKKWNIKEINYQKNGISKKWNIKKKY